MAEEMRLSRLEDKMSSLEVATAHGFGEVRQELVHLRELVQATIDRPAPAPPGYLPLIAASSFLTALAVLVLVITQAFR